LRSSLPGPINKTLPTPVGWLEEHADLAEEDPLLGLLPGAVAGAIDSFCEEIGSTAPEREDLNRAAREGLEQTISPPREDFLRVS
jgi:hypothetical protein